MEISPATRRSCKEVHRRDLPGSSQLLLRQSFDKQRAGGHSFAATVYYQGPEDGAARSFRIGLEARHRRPLRRKQPETNVLARLLGFLASIPSRQSSLAIPCLPGRLVRVALSHAQGVPSTLIKSNLTRSCQVGTHSGCHYRRHPALRPLSIIGTYTYHPGAPATPVQVLRNHPRHQPEHFAFPERAHILRRSRGREVETSRVRIAVLPTCRRANQQQSLGAARDPTSSTDSSRLCRCRPRDILVLCEVGKCC